MLEDILKYLDSGAVPEGITLTSFTRNNNGQLYL